MLKNIFNKKTQKEKEISKLENELYRYRKKLEVLRPEIQKRQLRANRIKTIPISRTEKIAECEQKIEYIQQKLIEIKNDKQL